MSSKYARVSIVITVILAAGLLANARTTFGQQKGGIPADTIIMTVQLQPHENEFLAKDGYFQVNTLDVNASKGSKLCPSGDCQYSIENSQFRPNTVSGGYTFEGLLKVSVTAGDAINSKFYPISADLDKTASEEREGQTTEMLQGTIKFGKDTFSPDFQYRVDNGTLLVDPSAPVLTLRGARG